MYISSLFAVELLFTYHWSQYDMVHMEMPVHLWSIVIIGLPSFVSTLHLENSVYSESVYLWIVPGEVD